MLNSLLIFVQLLHILYILFVIVTPFQNNIKLLGIHFIFIPFMIFHWYIGNNTCSLTLIEQEIRKYLGDTNYNDCFTCRIIYPIYDVTKNYQSFSIFIYTLSILLWLLTTYKLSQI